MGTPTAMRGPGAVPASSRPRLAYDELAVSTRRGPRRSCAPKRTRSAIRASIFRSRPRHYVECLTPGARSSAGRSERRRVGSMRRDGAISAGGRRGCSWLAARLVRRRASSCATTARPRVVTGTQDIGTGTYTVLAQMAAEAAGVPIERIVVEIGDSRLPPGPTLGRLDGDRVADPGRFRGGGMTSNPRTALATASSEAVQGPRP